MALTDLPTELLARVYYYLDWDPAKDIRPNKRDIINVSLACRKLRDAALPVLFRSVRLELWWEHGALVKPKLYWLRRNHPRLSRYVRCVEIDTEFSRSKYAASHRETREVFTIPADIDDWIDPDSISSQYQAAIFSDIRAQANLVARQLGQAYTEENALPSGANRPAEEIIRELVVPETQHELCDHVVSSNTSTVHMAPNITVQNSARGTDFPSEWERRRSIRFSLEALAVALLCIPPSTDTLIFRAIPHHYRQYQRTEFGLRVAKAAMMVFKNRIRDLTVIMKQRFRTPPIDRSCTPQALPIEQEEDPDTNESISGLQSMERLVLTCCEEHEFPVAMSTLTRRNLFQWRQLDARVRHLDLRCARICYDDLVSFVKPFRILDSLRLNSIILDDHTRTLQPADLCCSSLIWLFAAIEIRRTLQNTKFLLGDLHVDREHALPVCSITWMVQEAVPSGVVIDADRQERLIEDFKSFMPLWQAEQTDRGAYAQLDWDQTGGALVDQAMSRRWR